MRATLNTPTINTVMPRNRADNGLRKKLTKVRHLVIAAGELAVKIQEETCDSAAAAIFQLADMAENLLLEAMREARPRVRRAG